MRNASVLYTATSECDLSGISTKAYVAPCQQHCGTWLSWLAAAVPDASCDFAWHTLKTPKMASCASSPPEPAAQDDIHVAARVTA